MEKDLTAWLRRFYQVLMHNSDIMYQQMTEHSVFGNEVESSELRDMFEAVYALQSEIEDFADLKGVSL